MSNYSLTCKRCGRKLKSEESRKRGYGAYCYRKICKDKAKDVDIDDQVEQIEGQLDLFEREVI